MSKKKSKKAKIHSQQRKQNRINEIENLKAQAKALEAEISKQRMENFKQLNIRNLKVFANTCNFLAPFVLSAGITAGVFRLFGGGLPFHSDEITKYKEYTLDYKSSGYVTMDEDYRTDNWYDDTLPENILLLYTPWQYNDGQYTRYKREFNIDSLDSLDLYDAVLSKDYNKIGELLTDFKEETQVTNTINSQVPNDYCFEASLHMLDKDDYLKYNETDLKNIIITIVELVIALGAGSAVAHFREFEYLYELRRVNRNYQFKISSINSIREKLDETNQKILSLTKRR